MRRYRDPQLQVGDNYFDIQIKTYENLANLMFTSPANFLFLEEEIKRLETAIDVIST